MQRFGTWRDWQDSGMEVLAGSTCGYSLLFSSQRCCGSGVCKWGLGGNPEWTMLIYASSCMTGDCIPAIACVCWWRREGLRIVELEKAGMEQGQGCSSIVVLWCGGFVNRSIRCRISGGFYNLGVGDLSCSFCVGCRSDLHCHYRHHCQSHPSLVMS